MQKLFLICSVLFSQFLNGQDLPLGYIEHYKLNLNSKAINDQLLTSAHTESKINKGVCFLTEKIDSLEAFNPSATFLVDNHIFGDFILDLSLSIQSVDTDSLSGLYFIVGLRDSTNYYFIQLNAHGAFFNKMYKGQVSIIDVDSTFILKEQAWHKVRITRDILSREILIVTGKQQVSFYDPNLVMGYLGLGVQDYSLAINKLIIWAPTSISKPAPLFR
jgi:hypothetical protein